MCEVAGSVWAFLLGGTLEFAGVALLIRGLSKTRKSFDPDWEGIPTWLSARFWSFGRCFGQPGDDYFGDHQRVGVQGGGFG